MLHGYMFFILAAVLVLVVIYAVAQMTVYQEKLRKQENYYAQQNEQLTQLLFEKNLLRSMLDTMHEGVLLIDASGYVVLYNLALRDLLWLPEWSKKQPLIELIRNADLKDVIERTSQDKCSFLVEIDLRQGARYLRLQVQTALVAAPSFHVLVVLTDVTHVRQLEWKNREFLANASHELRTPLTSIGSSAESLAELIEDTATQDLEAQKMFVEIIITHTKRLTALIDDLLMLSKIDNGHVTRSTQSISSLNEVFSYALGVVETSLIARHMEVQVDIQDEIWVAGEHRLLEQVFINLLENALKYCPVKTCVHIFIKELNTTSVLVVFSDNGVGIETEHLRYLFDRFYRVDEGRAREVGGTGLGLSIVKKIMESVGGQVHVESQKGQGCQFYLSFKRCL